MLLAFWAFVALFICGGIVCAFQAKRPKGSRPRLDVWHRAGIIVSAIGFVVGVLWQRTLAGSTAADYSGLVYSLCSNPVAHPDYNFSACSERSSQAFELMLEGSWETALALGALTILAAWLCAYMALWATRWILAGRRREPEPVAAE